MSELLSLEHAALSERQRDARMRPPQDGASRPAPPAPVKVIYIAGYGRSGTTLLDVALGQIDGVLGAGEITTLSRHVWSNGEFCACGATVAECRLWQDIVRRWQHGDKPDMLDAYHRSQRRHELLFSPSRAFDALAGRAGNSSYAVRTARLFAAITEMSGCPVIVDSSKLPGRGQALARVPGLDLYVVHMVRDGRGVAWSLRKPHLRAIEKGVQRELHPKPLLHVALRWSLVNLEAERLCATVGRERSLRVRYEDFVDDPAGTVDMILALVSGEQTHAMSLDMQAPIAPFHQMAGSRHRMSKSIAISRDEKWKHEMPAGQQRLFSVLGAPLLRRYGYLDGDRQRLGSFT